MTTKFLGTFNRTDEEDPLKGFLFQMEIDGFARYGFNKISGLNINTEKLEYREGNQSATVRKSPGLTTFDDITLERGVILATGQGAYDIITWHQQVHDAKAKGIKASGTFRKTPELVMFNREGEEVMRWVIKEAWPIASTPIPELGAQDNNNLIESMTLTHEGCYLVSQ